MKKYNAYNIVNFNTARHGMSAAGFIIVLDKHVAADIVQLKRPTGEHLTGTMIEILSGSLGEYSVDPYSVRYFKDTWLLESFHVGGNCACFSASGVINRSCRDDSQAAYHFDRHVRYEPHNIDSPTQAGAILSMWLQWFNTISSLAGIELPYNL